MFGCFGLSLLSSVMTITSLAVAGRLLGEMVAWDAAFLAGPLIVVANCLPITPSGIGLAEAASSELFAGLGASGGAEMMVLVRICGALYHCPGCCRFLPWPVAGRSQTQRHAPRRWRQAARSCARALERQIQGRIPKAREHRNAPNA